MPSSSMDSLLSVLDTLYEGVLDDAAWSRALHQVTDFVSGSTLTLFSVNPETNRVRRQEIIRIDPQVMRDYTPWISQDPRMSLSGRRPTGELNTEWTLMREKDFRQSSIYNEFLRRVDLPHVLGTWVERTPTRGVVMSIQGSGKRGAFSDEDRLRMSRLIPHLRRCVEVKDSLQATGGSHHALLSVADRLPFGTVILAQDWQILEASAGARSLFAHRSALHADQGRLGFTRDRDRKAFADRLNEDPGRARLHDIVLVARAGRPTLSLLVVPIKPQKEPWFRPAAAWLVLIFDPELTSGLSESSIRTALRITPAEAALGKQLALGRSLGEAADRLTLSRHTVRAQLKSIYRKLGIDSQSELVCRILTGPAGLIHSRSPTSDPADRPA